jgi:hypothetical protein
MIDRINAPKHAPAITSQRKMMIRYSMASALLVTERPHRLVDFQFDASGLGLLLKTYG